MKEFVGGVGTVERPSDKVRLAPSRRKRGSLEMWSCLLFAPCADVLKEEKGFVEGEPGMWAGSL